VWGQVDSGERGIQASIRRISQKKISYGKNMGESHGEARQRRGQRAKRIPLVGFKIGRVEVIQGGTPAARMMRTHPTNQLEKGAKVSKSNTKKRFGTQEGRSEGRQSLVGIGGVMNLTKEDASTQGKVIPKQRGHWS